MSLLLEQASNRGKWTLPSLQTGKLELPLRIRINLWQIHSCRLTAKTQRTSSRWPQRRWLGSRQRSARRIRSPRLICQAVMLSCLFSFTGKKAENLREQKTFGKCSSRTEKSCLCRWPVAEVNLHDQLHTWHLNISMKTSSWIREKLLFVGTMFSSSG